MSEFPHGWSTRVIEEICDIHDYRRIPLSSEERRERKGPYPYYGANNIQDRIDDFIFDFDAVLIAEDGGYYDEYEYRDIAQYATGKYWVNNHAHILTGKPGLDTRFLYYALVRKNICPWINTGTRSKLNQSDLKQIELLVPPLPEQKKIAEILSGIDREIELLDRRIQKLCIAKAKASEDILSSDHSEKKLIELSDCIDLTRGYAFKSGDYIESGGTRILRVTNIKEDGRVDLATNCVQIPNQLRDHYRHFEVQEDDLLLVMVGATTGKLGIASKEDTPSLLNQNIWCLRSSSPTTILQRFLHCSMPKVVAQHLEKQQGSARDFLTQKEFFKEHLEIPNIDLQEKVVNATSCIDRTILATKEIRAKIGLLRFSLASDLLSGRKRVSI
jgi:type I restriction enzyme, S subunit